MVSESNPARPRRSRVESTDAARRCSTHNAARPRRAIAGLGAVVAGIAVLMTAPLAAHASFGASFEASTQALTASERSVGGVIVRVAPTVGTTITPGAPIALEVEVENATAETIAAGSIRLLRSAGAIDQVDELDMWVAQGTEAEAADGADDAAPEAAAPDSLDGVVVAEAGAGALAPGAVDVISVTLPPEAIDDVDDTTVIGLGAELHIDGVLVASSTEAYANTAVRASDPISLALAYPLTVPAAATGLLAAEDLATWTSPFGLLSRQLDAVAGRSVAIAIDPRIIASIRVLGTAAPPSSLVWLDRLAELPNEIFPLAYADADVAAQVQLGLPAPLVPTSFADALDPADFDGDTADDGDDVPPTDATPAPDEEPTAPPTGELPTTEQLLEWPYTRADIAWPADDTVAVGNLGVLAASGLTTAILAPGNVEAGEPWSNAASNVDASTAVVADARITEPLREASEALTDTEWRAATGLLGAELALGSSSTSARPLTLLATFDRGAGTQSARVTATLDALAANPAVVPASISDAIGAPTVDRTLVDLPETDPRRANVDRLVRAEADITAFSSILAEPQQLSGPARRDLLALLDVAWLDDRPAWDAAVGEWLLTQRNTLGAVSVVPSSQINVVSSETGVPTTILNALPYPVTVVVDVDPSNGRLIVDDQATVTVEPESRRIVRVPVAAGIGNGKVNLTVSLTSPTGVPIGAPVVIPANVQADWEGLGAAILGIVVVAFFGIGVWRNIRRLRKQRADRDAAEASEATDAAGTTELPSATDASGATTTATGESGDERNDG